jgi:SAM-dependent methyltransferase
VDNNVDPAVVAGFGAEWSRFTYSETPLEEIQAEFDVYFRHVDRRLLAGDVLDVGCGSGRWAQIVARTASRLTLVDPSEEAIEVARRSLRTRPNCRLHVASVDALPVPDDSQDLVYSLGVLHHIPDPQAGLISCARAVKPGGSLLVYLYYRFDNRPRWFRSLWKASDLLRRVIARQPIRLRRVAADALAFCVYLPLARVHRALDRRGRARPNFPLAAYAYRSLYWIRNDALDRFGTRLEHRFTQEEIGRMLQSCGLENVRFVEDAAFWTAVADKPKRI